VRYYDKTQKQLSRAYHIFKTVNLEEVKVIKKKYKEYKKLAVELEKLHFLRIRQDVKESVETSEYHLELISYLRAIMGHATNVGRILLQWNASKEK
jgi:Na+/phosphate symporter